MAIDKQLMALKTKLNLLEEEDTTLDDRLMEYLEDAKWAILNRRYPYGTTTTEIEPRYMRLQLRIAAELFAKDGAEGEVSHEEMDVSRTYESSGISESLLREVVPVAKVL